MTEKKHNENYINSVVLLNNVYEIKYSSVHIYLGAIRVVYAEKHLFHLLTMLDVHMDPKPLLLKQGFIVF